MTQNGAPPIPSETTPPLVRSLPKPVSPYLDVEKLRAWTRMRSSPEQGKYRCVLFMLSHSSEKGLSPISTVPIPPKLAEPDERYNRLDIMLEEFQESSNSFALQFPKPQLFVVSCHLTDKEGEHAYAQYPFRVEPPPDMADTFQDTEAPTMSGVVATLQRQNDNLIRESSKEKDRYIALIERQYEHMERLEKGRWDLYQQREQIADGGALRAQEMYKSKIDTELQADLWRKLMEMGMPIAAKYAEKMAGVEGATREHPLMTFAKTLEPKQLVPFVGSLSKQQREMFAPMAKTLIDQMGEDDQAMVMQMIAEQNQIQVTIKAGPTEPLTVNESKDGGK